MGISESSTTHVFNKTMILYVQNIQRLLTFICYLLQYFGDKNDGRIIE
jgi:hypothetical protein